MSKRNQNYITAGEFARLSQSTKRTVVWYDKQNILKPAYINSKGYRFYLPEQIIDYQVITLLKRLGFSLPQIKKAIRKNSDLKKVFRNQEQTVLEEIENLQISLDNIRSYYSNLDQEGLWVKPDLKKIPAFDIYYLDKSGPYAKIYEYAFELKSYFLNIPKEARFATFFYIHGYFPKNDRFKVAVIAEKGIRLNPVYSHLVKKETIPSFKALSYMHRGSPALISLIIKQLRMYVEKHGYRFNESFSFSTFEIYHKTALNEVENENRMVSEIIFPIL